jgi:hypothetical protein
MAVRALGPTGRTLLAYTLADEMRDRGRDSWGFYDPLSRQLHRSVGDVVAAVRDLARHRVLMCHTRQATSGKVCRENAHPFHVGGVVAAHNGIVYNEYELDKRYGAVAVDSLHLVAALSQETADAIRTRMEECEGYAALTWCGVNGHPVWNTPSSVYATRATQSASLCAITIKMGKRGAGSVWASTEYAAKKAAMHWVRCGGSYTIISLPPGHVTQATEAGWYTVPGAPDLKLSDSAGAWRQRARYSFLSRGGSFVTMPNGGSVWQSYESQMDELEEQYKLTQDPAIMSRWMELSAKVAADDDDAPSSLWGKYSCD